MKIIEYSLRYRPSANWIVNNSKLPYLKLNMSVPYNEIYAEWQTVKEQAVDHRADDALLSYKNQGWKSLVLYGTNATATQESSGTLDWTDIASKCPKTTQWLKDNFIIDNTTGRIRFMLLDAGGYILPHKDREEKFLYETNIAIHNPKENVFRFTEYGNVPFENGDAYMLDISNKHFVVNNSNEDRLHIIVHAKVDSKLIEESYGNRYYN